MASALATLAQIKDFIGNTGDATDDALLTRMLDASAEMLERSCNRVFALASYTETRDGNGQNFMVFNNRPITAVSSVAINGQTVPQSTNVAAGGWVLASQWKIALRGAYAFTEGVQNVTVTYTAGYATIPADLTQACCVLTSLAYKERDRMGIDAKTVGGENISFSKDDIPPAVQAVINNYRNVYWA